MIAPSLSADMSKPGATPGPVVYQFAQRPQELSFCQFLYNKDTGEILGRTPASWREYPRRMRRLSNTRSPFQ